MSFYQFGRFLCEIICRFFGLMRIVGADNVPKKGGLLVCGNHISYMDPPAIGAATRRTLHFMAKHQLFDVPVLGKCLHWVQAFPVNQKSADRAALKKAIEYIKAGKAVAMFPEGERRFDGTLGKALPGAAMIALRSGTKVVPAAIIGTDKLLPKGASFFKFAHISVIFGKPIDFDDLANLPSREAIDAVGERIMDAIARLIEENK